MALLPLLGVTWLVGFFLDLHYAVGYLFILLNSAQVQFNNNKRLQVAYTHAHVYMWAPVPQGSQ